jgi:uncharacterized membrane protein (DUF485 family)
MHFDHQSVNESAPQSLASQQGNARLGMRLFIFYTSLYSLFVAISAFSFSSLAIPVFGVPAAVTAGFGLILGAIILAVLYARACTSE